MNENIHALMDVGVVHFKAFPPGLERGEGPIVETLRKICEDEFWTAVEVGWMRDYRVRNEARYLLEQSHLRVAYGTQPKVLSNKLNLNSLDPAVRAAAVSSVKSCVDEAYDLGASVIRLIAGKDPGDEKREEAKKLLVDSLQQIMEYAKDEGNIGFTLKIFDRNVDKKSLIGHFSDALDVAKALRPDFPNFGLLSDLSHFALLGEKPEDGIALIKDYLVDVHIGNCVVRDRHHPLYGDIQPRFGVPGGEVDLPEVIEYFRILRKNGFFDKPVPPIVSAEVRPLLAGEISEVVLANTKRVIQQAWARA